MRANRMSNRIVGLDVMHFETQDTLSSVDYFGCTIAGVEQSLKNPTQARPWTMIPVQFRAKETLLEIDSTGPTGRLSGVALEPSGFLNSLIKLMHIIQS